MLRNGGGAMRRVNIEKNKLLEKVKENLEKHIKEYNEAVEDYIAVVQEICVENVKTAKRNLKVSKEMNGVNGDFNLPKMFPSTPVSYENEYNRAIAMLEMSADEIIELESEVFNQLVLDEWEWKRNFEMTNTLYKTLRSN